MKKTVTLYKDSDFGEIYTEDGMEELYHDSIYHTVYDSYLEFIMAKTDDGTFEEITATLSDGKTVYPFYWLEYDEVQTIMEMYIAFHDCTWISRHYNNLDTFADFLNIPQEDRNCVAFYGFEG